MKIEQLIVQYLYQHKTVSIQNIGRFSMSADIIQPTDSEKDAVLPDNAISFEYDSKALQDDNLINYIVQQTKKIKPLAASDLESFSILTRQFINIGKPHVIEGLGTLLKNQQGQYEFQQGHTVAHISRPDAPPAEIKEKEKETIDFSSPSRRTSGNKWILPVILIAVVLGALAFFYSRYNENKKEKEENLLANKPGKPVEKKDSVPKPVVDTNLTAVSPPTVVPRKDSFTFKIVIREFAAKEAAQQFYNRFTSYGHKLLMYPKDSSITIVSMPFVRSLADTTKLRDSLRIYYGGRPYVAAN